MARIALLVPDLLFGSQVQATLTAAGHQAVFVTAAQATDGDFKAVLVDLTADAAERIAAVSGVAPGVRKLAFYSHVEADVREAALSAGFDVVVPRSRMAREGAAVVERALSSPS